MLNDTVRNNILYGCEFDEARYARVLAACSLADDIAALTRGDATEVHTIASMTCVADVGLLPLPSFPFKLLLTRRICDCDIVVVGRLASAG